MKKERKSQQSIIVVVLLVLIGLVAVAAVGLFIMKNIQTSVKMSELKSKSMEVLTELKSAKITDDGKIAAVTIGLGEGKSDETITRRANIVISNAAGQTQTYVSSESLSPVSYKTYYVPLTITAPNKIEVLPVLISGTQNYVGSASDSIIPTNNPSEINKDNMLKNGLMGYWSFDVDARDDSGNGNDGVVSGATLIDAGKIRKAYQFDGNDKITISNSVSLNLKNSFTILAWAKLDTKNVDKVILAKDGEYILRYTLGANLFSFYLKDNLDYDPATHMLGINPSLNTWYFLAGTWDGMTQKAYLDGVLKSSTPHEFTPTSTLNNLVIGDWGSSDYFNGAIDEVRIYNRVLSAEEINYIYNNP